MLLTLSSVSHVSVVQPPPRFVPASATSLLEARRIGCLGPALAASALLSCAEPVWHLPQRGPARDGAHGGDRRGDRSGHYGPGGGGPGGGGSDGDALRDECALAAAAHQRFLHPLGDHLTCVAAAVAVVLAVRGWRGI